MPIKRLMLKPTPAAPTLLKIKVYEVGRKAYDLMLKCKTYEVVRRDK